MEFKFNSKQLEIGNGIVSNVSSSLNTYKGDVEDEFDNLKSFFSSNYKINFENTIKYNDIDSDFDTILTHLDDVNNKAIKAANLAQKYSDDPSTINYAAFKEYFNLTNTMSNPTWMDRTRYTVYMGAWKFGEGFAEFFEDIGDCAIIVGSGVASLLGHKDTAKKWRKFAEEDKTVELFEDNAVFEKINRYSYFDKDSVYANIFKIGGKATAAVVTGKVASGVFKSLSAAKNVKVAEDAVSTASNVEKAVNTASNVEKTVKTTDEVVNTANTVEKAVKTTDEVAKTAGRVEKTANSISSNVGTFGSKTRDNLEKGYGLKQSMVFAAGSVALDSVADKFASPLTSKVGEKVAATRVGDGIRKVNDVSAKVFKSDKDAVDLFTKKAVDYSFKEAKSKTNLNAVSDDGNDSSMTDQTVDNVKNKGADIAKSTLDSAIKSAL